MIRVAEQKREERLSTEGLNEFRRKAVQMNHDPWQLMAGHELTSYFRIPSFPVASEILSNLTFEQKRSRLPGFFNASLTSRSKLGQGKHDRGEAVVFAGAAVSTEDSKGIDRHFPLHTKGISVLHKRVNAGEIWDVSVSGDVFGLDGMEELYVNLNIGTLILEADAKLVIRGNVFSILCQELICMPGSAGWQIGILPTPHSVDFGHGPFNGKHGDDGMAGCNGADGVSPGVQYGILGAWIPEGQDPDCVHGTDGTDGADGEDGAKGRNGGMCKLADITIHKLEGSLTVFSQAGAGGNGGDGGSGGNGGNGGRGAAGCKGFNLQIADGRNGSGGRRGAGGRGGNAGHGGLASNIYVNVPHGSSSSVSLISQDSVGGSGGLGGVDGAEGTAGNCVDCGSVQSLSRAKPGHNGRSRPAAFMYLNNTRVLGAETKTVTNNKNI